MIDRKIRFSRSKDVIEPILKAQWYVACDKMAARAVEAVEKVEIWLFSVFKSD